MSNKKVIDDGFGVYKKIIYSIDSKQPGELESFKNLEKEIDEQLTLESQLKFTRDHFEAIIRKKGYTELLESLLHDLANADYVSIKGRLFSKWVFKCSDLEVPPIVHTAIHGCLLVSMIQCVPNKNKNCDEAILSGILLGYHYGETNVRHFGKQIIKGRKFDEGPKHERSDDLKKLIIKIMKDYFNENKKLPVWCDIINKFEIYDMEGAIVQDVDWENEVIEWENGTLSFNNFRQRLTRYRKIFKKNNPH